jgi:hypothetical protein
MSRSLIFSKVTSGILILLVVCTPTNLAALAHVPTRTVTSPQDQALPVKATASAQGVLIEWQTGVETTLGFNVYQVSEGRRLKLNPTLIAGSALVVGQRLQNYAWLDTAGRVQFVYEVESIDMRGEPASHGTAESISGSFSSRASSPLLTNLGKGSDKSETQQILTESDGEKRSFFATGTSPGTAISDQWSIANQPALKIGVKANGWYRVTQPQMQAAGFDTTGDVRNLSLFVEGMEIAIAVSRDSGPLSAADSIEFWGQGLVDIASTDTRVYWLVKGTRPGRRIAVVGERRVDESPTQNAGAPLRTTPPISSQTWGPNLPSSPPPSTTTQRRSAPDVAPDGDRIKNDQVLRFPVAATNYDATEAKRSAAVSIGPLEAAPPSLTSNMSAAPIRPASVKALSPSPPGVRTPKRPSSRRPRKRPHRRSRRRNHTGVAVAAVPAFIQTIEFRDRHIYYSAALNGDRENFFGPVVFGDGPVVTLSLHNIETTSSAPAQLQIALQGVSIEPHVVKVFVNGLLAGTIGYDEEAATTQSFSIPNSWLVEGDNAVRLVPVFSSHDTSLVQLIRVTYPHSFRADSDSLQFSLKSTQTAKIEGFSNANVRVLDVSDPASVQEIEPVVEPSGAGFAATIAGGERGKARQLVALPSGAISQPAWLTLNQPSTLNLSTNAADLIIISHKDFISALAPLVTQRQAQGYLVRVMDVEDVYDEFSFGEHTPQAIRDFLWLARNNWTRAPSYLLLVGDASYDPKNYQGAGSFDFVPTKLVDTGTAGTATALEAMSDDWFTDFDSDGIADIAVGRLPVRTIAEANLVVSKIVNYSPANTGNKALLVADTQGSYYFNFEAANDQVATTLPAGMTIQKVYRRLQASDANAKANIIANLNSGQSVTVYSGHGNVNIWGGSIFTSTDADALTNGNRLSFVVVMDCLNGYFADPTLKSLAESILSAPNGGAVASFASSGLTIPDGQHEMGFKMFQLLYSGTPMAIGDASRLAKSATMDMDVRRTWILFGDPTLKIR